MLASYQLSSNRLAPSADISRLPLKTIEVALRKTTEVLASELAEPTEMTPDWTDFEWCIARAAAAIHGVSPLLSGTLRWRGPEGWERFLREQREHTFQRHQRIANLLADIGSRASRDGIAIVPLKGATLHRIGIYQPGERPMSDIDLLVHSEDRQATAQLLGACGYHGTCTTWKNWEFEPDAEMDTLGFGEHARNPIKIELHTRVVERLPIVDRDISTLLFPLQATPGLNSYRSITALMLHLLTHAAGNMCFNAIRLLHLHDIAQLSRRMTTSEWEGVLVAANGKAAWWVSPPLTLTAHYYASAIPTHIVARAESECQWLLRQVSRRRTLSDVSLSNLWIQAFPGIEWSHSMRETLRYVMSRVKPNAELLIERSKIRTMYPDRARFSWPHLPQWQRILRWIFQRPARVETLTSVYGALAPPDTLPPLTHHS